MLFEELSLLLVALSSTGKDMLSICNDAVSAFSLLCLAKDVSARLVVGFTNSGNSDVVGIYNDVFAALCALCDSVVYLGPRSQIFMGMGSVLLLSAVDHLTTFTKLLPIHPTTHLLKPALVRELYKHGTKLAKDGRTNDSVTLLVTLLEVRLDEERRLEQSDSCDTVSAMSNTSLSLRSQHPCSSLRSSSLAHRRSPTLSFLNLPNPSSIPSPLR